MKAEAAKLPGAGIWPEAVARKMSARKTVLTEISQNRERKQCQTKDDTRERCQGWNAYLRADREQADVLISADVA